MTIQIDPGIVDQDIDTTTPTMDESTQLRHAALRDHIQRVEHHIQPFGQQPFESGLAPAGIATGDDNSNIALGQLPDHFQPQSAIGTSDYRYEFAIFTVQHHPRLFRLSLQQGLTPAANPHNALLIQYNLLKRIYRLSDQRQKTI